MRHCRRSHPHVRDNVYNCAPMRSHPLRIGFSRHQEATGEIGTHDGFPTFLRDAGKGRCKLAAGVVDQAINAPETAQHLGNGALYPYFLTDIAGEAFSSPAGTCDLFAHYLKLLGTTADEGNLRSQ